MTFERDEHPDQLELGPILDRPATNAERQRAYRQRQKALGRKAVPFYVTSLERHYLERVLEEMRETGGKPATMRNPNGTMRHIDV